MGNLWELSKATAHLRLSSCQKVISNWYGHFCVMLWDISVNWPCEWIIGDSVLKEMFLQENLVTSSGNYSWWVICFPALEKVFMVWWSRKTQHLPAQWKMQHKDFSLSFSGHILLRPYFKGLFYVLFLPWSFSFFISDVVLQIQATLLGKQLKVNEVKGSTVRISRKFLLL